MDNGSGYTINFDSFFAYNKISGCDLTCNYGSQCGASKALNAKVPGGIDIFTEPATSTWAAEPVTPSPYVLTAINDVVAGYAAEDVCLYCVSNHLVSVTHFE